MAGLRSGVIDAVATDHAPHAAIEKEVPFEVAPNGVLGLEWAAAVANMTAGLDQADFFDRMSVAPAAIATLERHGHALAVAVMRRWSYSIPRRSGRQSRRCLGHATPHTSVQH